MSDARGMVNTCGHPVSAVNLPIDRPGIREMIETGLRERCDHLQPYTYE